MFEKLKSRAISVSPAYFGVGMGLGGLGSAWATIETLHWGPAYMAHGIFAIALISVSLVTLMFAAKLIFHRSAAIEDFCDTNIANFFPGFTITLLLLSSWFDRLGVPISTTLWTFAALLHVALAVSILRIWVVHNVDITNTNPSMFVPIVGLFVVPGTLPMEGSTTIALFCFAVALLFWLALLPVVLNRILFHGQLPTQVLPTLFILIAPPALAASAIVVLMGAFTPIADLFFFAGLFIALLIATMAKQFSSLTFQMSWWAFTFPSAALAGTALKRYTMATEPDFGAGIFAVGLLILATLIIGFVSWCTVRDLVFRRGHKQEETTG